MARWGVTGKYVKRHGVGVRARFSRIGSFKRMRGHKTRPVTVPQIPRAPASDEFEYAEFFKLVMGDLPEESESDE